MSYMPDTDPTVPSPVRSRVFNQFLEQHYPILVGYLNKRVGSRDDAQDVAQESVSRLMRYAHHPPEVLKPLLFRIALNVMSDSRRRGVGAFMSSHGDMDAAIEEMPSDELSPDEHAQHQQELSLARNAILRLPDHCKQIYLLNRMDNLSYPQIAKRYGISVKAIEKQMSKALTLINRHLTSHGAGRKPAR
jgi:RNA polymerase sigma factor (sigma-70 family)